MSLFSIESIIFSAFPPLTIDLYIDYELYSLFSALYDFDAKNYGELSIFEGQKIDLLSQLDDEWYEGRVDGTIGYFPINYVKILVPLPK